MRQNAVIDVLESSHTVLVMMQGLYAGNAEISDTADLLISKACLASLFKILCKCLFSEVTVQAVTELDNKAAHCHSPVLQRHRPFPGRRLNCQPHHFFH